MGRRKMRMERRCCRWGKLAAMVRLMLAARSRRSAAFTSVRYFVPVGASLANHNYFHMSALPIPPTLTALGLPILTMLSLPRNPLIRPGDERWYVPLFSVRSLYVVELKLSSRSRLARQTHAQSVEKSIVSLALRFCYPEEPGRNMASKA
jgi:hypothetical protein